MAKKLPKRKPVPTPWLPEEYKKVTLCPRAAIYMALHPGTYFTWFQLCRRVSNSWPAIEKYCMRLAAVGLVLVKVFYLKAGKRRYDLSDDLLVGALATPEHLYDPPGNSITYAFAASPRLVKAVKSGEFLTMITRPRKAPDGPVNDRIIQTLLALRPQPITVKRLKAAIDASDSQPDIACRLEQLAAADLVDVTKPHLPSWTNNGYYFAREWQAKLSAGGWLRIQRAHRDGVPLTVPKPDKGCWKAMKEAEV